jgi:hypothetical protein
MFRIPTLMTITLAGWLLTNISLASQIAADSADSLKVKVTRHKGEHPMPTPSPGKAMVYILRPESECDNLNKSFYITAFSINGKWTGMVTSQSYSFFEIDPGAVEFRALDLEHSWGAPPERCRTKKFVLDVIAGNTYFFRTNSDWCGNRHRIYKFDVKLMDDIKALNEIKRLDYVSWENRRSKQLQR